MKKRITLLIAAALMAVAGVQAATERIYFNLADATKEWNGEKLTFSGNTLTYENTDDANAAVTWAVTDISGYSKLVLELEEATTANVEVCVLPYGFWGPKHMTILETGQTKLSIPLTGLKITNDANTDHAIGEEIDLTNAGQLMIRTGWGKSQVIKIKRFYLAPADIDQVIEQATTIKSNFNVSDAAFSTTIWGTNQKTEASNSFLIKDFGGAVGWEYWWTDKLDISSYSSLVVKLKDVAAHPYVQEAYEEGGETKYRDTETVNYENTYYPGIELRIFGKKDAENNAAGQYTVALTTANNYQVTIDLTNGLTTNQDGAEAIDLSMINSIRFWSWSQNASATIEEMYLAKPGTPNVYLIRENTAADKYGTICLSFAASKPSNATVYDVVGWNATNVYLNEVTELEAGKGYVFQSTDAEDITFTKTSAADNLTEPARGNALDGYFDAAERYVPAESYILVGSEWKRVPSANRNQVGLYRAYFTKVASLEVTTPPAGARAMTFDGGETTGIDEVPSSKIQVSGSDIFDLSGRKVSQPMRGIYVKNGKKYVVK